MTVLAIIGGSGLYQMREAEQVAEHRIETKYGAPSDTIIEARIGKRQVFFLPRHGRGHRLTPSEVPYRANIQALKQLGVTHVAAISAVGIMAEHIKPGDMVLPDQLFDATKGLRDASFFGGGTAGHLPFADPFCPQMREALTKAARPHVQALHTEGTYVCIEGPRFSTRAESHFFRKTLQPAVIGMTASPEAALAREAEMSYALLGLATDYDCWHVSEDDVSVAAVLEVLKANAQTAHKIIAELAKTLPESLPALYAGLYKQMVVTHP